MVNAENTALPSVVVCMLFSDLYFFFMILTIFSSLSWLAFSASFPLKVKKTTNYKLNLQQQKIQRNILTLAY